MDKTFKIQYLIISDFEVQIMSSHKNIAIALLIILICIEGLLIETVVEADETTRRLIEPGLKAASEKWGRVITSTLPLIRKSNTSVICGSYKIASDLEGIRIFVTTRKMDGKKGILAQASPCGLSCFGSDMSIRRENNIVSSGKYYCTAGSNPDTPTSPVVRFGIMVLDADDIPGLVSRGVFENTILHEIGHVLGFGTVWNIFTKPLISKSSSDPRFIGAQANNAYGHFLDALNIESHSLKVENSGGAGTTGSHWREETYGNELMTGFLDGETQPMSSFTIASLGDLGYDVDLSKADSYKLHLEPGSNHGISDTTDSTGTEGVLPDGTTYKPGLATETIVFIAVGSFIGIGLLISLMCCMCKKSTKKQKNKFQRPKMTMYKARPVATFVTENPVSPLPPDWQQLLAPTGEIYYYNRPLRKTQWQRPSQNDAIEDGFMYENPLQVV